MNISDGSMIPLQMKYHTKRLAVKRSICIIQCILHVVIYIYEVDRVRAPQVLYTKYQLIQIQIYVSFIYALKYMYFVSYVSMNMFQARELQLQLGFWKR